MIRTWYRLWVLDAVLGCLAIAISAINWHVAIQHGWAFWYVADAIVITGLALVLFFRRTSVILAFIVTYALFSAMAALHYLAPMNLGTSPLLLAAPLSVMAVTRYGPGRGWGRAALGLGLLGSFVNPVTLTHIEPALAVGLCAATIIIAYLVALRQRDMADRYDAQIVELGDRTRLLEIERDQRAEIARNEERSRIARELHDIVAHSLTVIGVQASTGLALADTDPGQARSTLEEVRNQSRRSLTEMRYLVGVLRSPGQDSASPQPDLRQLSALVERARASGLSVDATLPADVVITEFVERHPAPLQLAVYRIVQEGLTNVLRHAGPSAHCDVSLELTRDYCVVTIRDSGSEEYSPSVPAGDGRHGNGLLGLRERVRVIGGELEAGPYRVSETSSQDHGKTGFVLRAELPIDDEIRMESQ